MLLLLIFLELIWFLSNVAALNIMVQSTTIVGQSSLVIWTREPNDGDGLLVFDLRFIKPGAQPEDVGLALANIQAPPSTQFGTEQVVFPSTGSYELVAVSGPNDTNLGASNEVNAYQVTTSTTSTSPTSTASATPSSTSQSIPSATMSASPKPTQSAPRRTTNLGAIIGGTLGGVAFLGLLAALVIVFLRRRQPKDNRRWTFHRSLMIRPPVLDIRPISPTLNLSASDDIEHGLPHDESTTSPIVMIASPSGPRPLLKPIYRPLPLPPGSEPLKPRQEEIVQQMEQVKTRIMDLEKNPGPTQHIMLDDMQKQMSWLQSQIGSPWALGLTDDKPFGFAPDLAG